MATKVCTKCGNELPVGQFYRVAPGSDRRRGDCKRCKARYTTTNETAKAAQYRAARKERSQWMMSRVLNARNCKRWRISQARKMERAS